MDRPAPSLGRALGLWMLYVVVFVAFGGLGAGLTAYIFEALLRMEFSDILYAIVFGAHGFMAYRLVQRIAERDA